MLYILGKFILHYILNPRIFMTNNAKAENNTENTETIEEVHTEEVKAEENTTEEVKTEKPVELTEIEKLEEENKKLNDSLLRTTADIQNMKRRAIEDRVSARFEGAKELLLPITKTIDDLNRAFSHIPEELQENEFIKSLQSIEEDLNKALTSYGIEFFAEPSEPFNANLHDSMMMDPNTEKDTIAQVFEKGIMLKGKVVRHAKVSVGSK